MDEVTSVADIFVYIRKRYLLRLKFLLLLSHLILGIYLFDDFIKVHIADTNQRDFLLSHLLLWLLPLCSWVRLHLKLFLLLRILFCNQLWLVIFARLCPENRAFMFFIRLLFRQLILTTDWVIWLRPGIIQQFTTTASVRFSFTVLRSWARRLVYHYCS